MMQIPGSRPHISSLLRPEILCPPLQYLLRSREMLLKTGIFSSLKPLKLFSRDDNILNYWYWYLIYCKVTDFANIIDYLYNFLLNVISSMKYYNTLQQRKWYWDPKEEDVSTITIRDLLLFVKTTRCFLSAVCVLKFLVQGNLWITTNMFKMFIWGASTSISYVSTTVVTGSTIYLIFTSFKRHWTKFHCSLRKSTINGS